MVGYSFDQQPERSKLTPHSDVTCPYNNPCPIYSDGLLVFCSQCITDMSFGDEGVV